MSTPSPEVIAIPTFRRPELLGRLLDSLRPEVEGRDVLIVIGDNDAGHEAAAVAAASSLNTVCIPVTERGISQVRNALIRCATQLRPQWELLLMLDDDGYVEPGWFEALVGAARTLEADVTGGPVLGSLPAQASLFARNSVYSGRERYPSGPVEALNGAQNIAISRRVVERLGDPWFPIELGSYGGEDYHFFKSVLHAGGTLAWCDEAQVTEPTPADRLRTAAIFRRAFRSNVLSARTDRQFHGSAAVARRVLGGVGITTRNVAAGLVRRDADRLARSALDTACLAGQLNGLAGRLPRGGHAEG
ncbi:glycosyltransferase family 2 protein [Gephyromycinifex aptenodytis]|uniref:glycosyltransferase family 2 protein n=1 Tax=Gephyromycinifex aptenodytis TaxID=2716227 RepID=UPI001446ADA5|nr:glycosyltransferase [Gephyromycinifex aptenodytis]